MSDLDPRTESSKSNDDESLEIVPVGCCSLGRIWKSFRRNSAIMGLSGVTLASLFVAAFFAGKSSSLSDQVQSQSTSPAINMPTLDATAAVTSEKFSMCTGPVSERSEGLFVLDHNSGLLQCSVMYPRQSQFRGVFTANVKEALGSGAKGASFMMTTGLVDVPASNTNPVAASFVYILNTSTGEYACYGIPFNRVMMNSGKPQQGFLVLIAKGNADPTINRDRP